MARVCAAEGIDADLVKGGELSVAATPAQHERLREELAADREWGLGEDEVRYLGPAELAARVRIAGGLGGLYSPHCARIQPAKLVTGLAGAVERAGVQIYEATPVTRIEPGRPGSPRAVPARACTVFGDVTPGSCCGPPRGSPPGCPGSAGTCCR